MAPRKSAKAKPSATSAATSTGTETRRRSTRIAAATSAESSGAMDDHRASPDEVANADTAAKEPETPSSSWAGQNQWIVFAVASGACAAFNGAFAKLTTNELTTSMSQGIAALLGLSSMDNIIEFVVRCIFFGLNMTFNGVMWTLFTKALARGQSSTQVSIMNTSANFVITAILGLMIFSESLPPLWWVGAAMLVAGNVIIGRKDDGAEGSTSETEPILVAENDAAQPK